MRVTGYVYKLAKSNPFDKGANFIVVRALDEESRILKSIPLNAYTSLPSYNPLILFTIDVRESQIPGSNLYEVVRVVECKKRFDKKGILGSVLQKFFGFQNPIRGLPPTIKYQTDITQAIPLGVLRDRLLTLCEPWFRGPHFFDMLRYFPETFLLRLSDDEIFYLLCTCLARPFTPCFRVLLDRCVSTPVAVYVDDEEDNTHKRLLFGKKDHGWLKNDRSYSVDDFKAKKLLRSAGPLYYDITFSMWSLWKYKLFCEDHASELQETYDMTKGPFDCYLIADAVSIYIACERETFKNGHVCFSDTQVSQKGQAVVNFLLQQRILKVDCLSGPSLATHQYIYPEAEMQELEFVDWMLTSSSKVEVYNVDLDCEDFFKYFESEIVIRFTSNEKTLILCNSFISATEYTWRYGKPAYFVDNWLGMLEDKAEEAKESVKELVNVMFFKSHRMSLDTINKAIKAAARWRRSGDAKFSVYFVGVKNEKVTFVSSCFRELARCLKSNDVEDTVNRVEGLGSDALKLYKHIELQNSGRLQMTNYTSEEHGVKLLYRWIDEKKNKGLKKQIFCTTEEMKKTLLTLIFKKNELYYGPGMLFLGHKVSVPSIGHIGILTKARKKTKSDTWLDVTNKRLPIRTHTCPYELIIESKKFGVSVTINTADHPCVSAEVETIARYPDDIVDVGMFFVSKDTSDVELVQAAKLCKDNLHIYKNVNLNFSIVYNNQRSHYPSNCMANKIVKFI